ncbi:hypothetical protein NS506_06189 [Nocardia seriolae]|uniref:Integral membrane protein n=1 Tax=Nocardia seriolae TaxID=37332 RepID=A0ABC9YQY1_9NOCA|nr:hypothetical protein NS506_06189 [Nocardia seriolae]BEK94457.1 hypothetical protein NSER024013_23630 [Nocardia seriolae]GAM45666.1 hypothetical protein NS07_v2contig00018-0034 [Nocardia seriolae]GAP27690.1 hypothetical protein NSK11_contig00022-0034 [Nocardia seriolae]
MPVTVRVAGVLVAAEGALALAAAVHTGARLMSGAHPVGAVLTAALLIALAAAVLLSGIELIRGRWWPRTVATITQILLLGLSALSLTTRHLDNGLPLALLATTVLTLLFSPPANRWMATPYDLTPTPHT